MPSLSVSRQGKQREFFQGPQGHVPLYVQRQAFKSAVGRVAGVGAVRALPLHVGWT